uniref:E3 ubiquitin-protein ligase UPL2-like n=1 Tax=Tanacetum cinerariifolium TaxID=118510 RepID=A0A6L2JY80_TANCI|nr:E3 ubiquitin-protein ligase UPL2-like [Tanacetum cinerariifolium]
MELLDHITNPFNLFPGTQVSFSSAILGQPFCAKFNVWFGVRENAKRERRWPSYVQYKNQTYKPVKVSLMVKQCAQVLKCLQMSHLVVSCVCASIEGISPSMLADCLGLDPLKFKSSKVANNDRYGSVMGVANDEERSATFIDMGLVRSLTRTLHLLDLDHADSLKVAPALVKVLELVTKEHVHVVETSATKTESSKTFWSP